MSDTDETDETSRRDRAPVVLDRRRFLLAAMGGAGMLALGGCKGGGGGAGSASRVRLPLGAFGFPSPFAANGGPGYNQMSLLYDTLLWKDSTGQLLPWLAASTTSSDDHLTHTFELRDVTWSDGRPLTAADVVFTFDYFAKQRLPPPVVVQSPQGIAKVVAVAPKTVEITLERPAVTFSEQVAGSLPIIPEHIWSGIGEAAETLDVKVLVGSGAYRLASYKGDGESLLYEAREGYHFGKPRFGRIESIPLDDQLTGLLTGGCDVAQGMGLRPDSLSTFEDSRFGMVRQHGLASTNLYFNLDREGVLGDQRFRQACAMAIDRKEIVARLASGNGRPGNPGFLAPDNPFFADVPQYDIDVAGAGSLLDSAGYRMGANGVRQGPKGPLSLELLFSNNDLPMAELVIAALARIGVELRQKAVEIGPLLFGTKFSGAYDLALLFFPGPSPGGPNADPDMLRTLFSSASPPTLTSATGFRNKAFDELAEKQLATFDQAERKTMVAQMQKILAEQVPVLPMSYPETVLLFRRSVLDQWYFTPGQFPTSDYNKQLFITGQKTGTEIR